MASAASVSRFDAMVKVDNLMTARRTLAQMEAIVAGGKPEAAVIASVIPAQKAHVEDCERAFRQWWT